MIVIALPNKVKRVKRILDNNTKWCYIGKDIKRRGKITKVLGEGSRLYFKDRLHKIAEELRQPFPDFVAELGKQQKDQLNWWASRFASRSPFQTDFFLLLCYEALVEKIVKECEGEKRAICIFVEDPWLFYELREIYGGKVDMEFIGQPQLTVRKLHLLIRGVIYRILFAGWLFVEWVLMFYYHGGRRPWVVTRGRNIVAVLSYAEKRAFVNGRYLDPYTGGLADLLEANRIDVLRPVYIKFPLSLSKEIGRLRDVFWPLIFDLRLGDVFLALLQWWSPRIPEDRTSTLRVNGHSVPTLLKREWWEELSKHSFNYNLIFYKAMFRFLRKGWCRSLVYIYENQPWEKLLCLAVKKANSVKVIGYQHSSMPRFLLSQFLGKGEEAIIPLPDKILTTGPYLLELYKGGGIPAEKLCVGGAWQYKYLWEGKDSISENSPTSQPTSKHIVLVALPVDPVCAKALLLLIAHNLSHVAKKNMEFWIKPHPDVSLSKLGIKVEDLGDLRIVDEGVDKLFEKVSNVIYSSSGVGLEALLYGNKRVIRYVPENLIDMDRIEWINQAMVYTIYDGDQIEEALSGEVRVSTDKEDLYKLCDRYFARVESKVWLEELQV